MKRLRLVMITSGSRHGVRILRVLERRGVQLDYVVLMAAASWNDCRQGRPKEHPARTTALAPLRWVNRRLRARAVLRRWPRRAFGRGMTSGRMNSAQLVEDLRRLSPDVLLLGSHEIAPPEVLDTASKCVLNAHPGLLPWLRGSGVVAHALLQGIPVGASCHEAIATVDAGPILHRRLLHVAPGDVPLSDLEAAALELAAETMGDVVQQISLTHSIPPALKQTDRHPMYRWPDEYARAEAELLARSGRAHQLLELWRPLCTDRDALALPNVSFETPPALSMNVIE